MSLWVSWHISKMTLFPNDQALWTVNTTIDLLFEIVKDNQPCQVLPTLSGSTYLVRFYPPCQAQGRLKNSPGRRSNFPAKDLVLHSSQLPQFGHHKLHKWTFCFSNNYCINKQQFYIGTWLPQLLPQLVILPGCQPTPLSPPHSSCPCDSNCEKVINFY